MVNIIRESFSQDLNTHLLICAQRQDEEITLDTKITDETFCSQLLTALHTLNARSVTTLANPANPSYRVIVAIAAADDATDGEDPTRSLFGSVARAARGLDRLVLASDIADLPAAIEGILLGSYVFTEYKEAKETPLGTLVIDSTDEDALRRAEIVSEATNRVRDLVNMAPNHLVPETLAQIADEEASAAGCDVRIYQGKDLAEIGAAGIIHVGRGSKNRPCLVRVEYRHPDAQSTTALVGKGITFDTGGYSLKPAQAMVEMKTDMAGAATVLQTVIVAARLELPVHVVGWMCCAENMISGIAGHPDDVIIYRNGTSVEINNTDAEGRLVLADGLLMASAEKPDRIIDIATLTGAQMVALGERVTGIMGTDDLPQRLCTLAAEAGESAWHMPLPTHLRKNLDSDVADIRNAGSRYGGMLAAGLFLKEFVDCPAWAHVDIAGPSFNRGCAYGSTPKGATGVMLRTLLRAVESR
ncbi:leucyl aminopeptidase [Trueperella sp. LYQ143]|uniref:leucyl aminopeptidase n=1 Tax=Trueperella sp. LYQ143 TaxID=3391059 RepID=UPI003983D2FC